MKCSSVSVRLLFLLVTSPIFCEVVIARASAEPPQLRRYESKPSAAVTKSAVAKTTQAVRQVEVTATRNQSAADRCLQGDDRRCDKRMGIDLARKIRDFDHQERAQLGADFCLFHSDDPRCKANEDRDARRSRLEIQGYCGQNSNSPRCIGYQLNEQPRASDEFGAGKTTSMPRDDFFTSPVHR